MPDRPKGGRPGELFLPLDVDFDQDEKVLRLSRFTRQGDARALRDLLVTMWRYCKRRTTDGHVPTEAVGPMVFPDPPRVGIRDADRLVELGIAERTADGYYFPSYLKRNKSRAQLAEERAAKAEAGRKGGVRSGESRRKQNGSSDEAGASVCLNTETETEAEAKNGTTKEGGDVSETSPNDGRAEYADHCLDHRYVQNPPPCGGCKEQRERNRKQDQRARLTVVGDCARCGGSGWIEHEDGRPARKCNHGRTA